MTQIKLTPTQAAIIKKMQQGRKLEVVNGKIIFYELVSPAIELQLRRLGLIEKEKDSYQITLTTLGQNLEL